MRTNELLLKNGLSREEKIAHLKKLGLWREFQIELKALEGDFLYPITLQHVLSYRNNWWMFISGSLIFRRTKRGFEFWHYVAKNGKKPLNK
jgi:hypothetical protein